MRRRTKPNADGTGPKLVLGVEGLGIRRGGTTILQGINWEIKPGQHWVVLGANGSGKTSLLSALTGYLTPTKGHITVLRQTYGRSDWRKLRLQIGLVSSSIRQLMAESEPALESVVSGKRAVIDWWGGMSRTEKKEGLKILQQIGCVHLADRPWAFLSQGERQRVLIGRALMARPRLLILDEPCAGLDPAAREHFLQWLDQLGRRKESPALVLVTHHVEEIMPVFTHALILSKGRVLASGPKSKVLTTKTLSKAFATRLRLRRSRGRYLARVARVVGRVI